jgi:hypothetical protein
MGKWVVNATPRPLNPDKNLEPTVQEAGWAPGPVWTGADLAALEGILTPDRPARNE